jgi:serine/threonine-protein kinase
MELLEGETLRDRLRRVKRMSPDDVRPLVEQMADALGAAHAAGPIVIVTSRARNVMLLDSRSDAPPRVVVTDSAWRNRLDDAVGGSSITIDGDFVGTPAYMAPEQIEGHAVTPATDVYSFDWSSTRMLTGERPFAGRHR